jgi:hypothetical protein
VSGLTLLQLDDIVTFDPADQLGLAVWRYLRAHRRRVIPGRAPKLGFRSCKTCLPAFTALQCWHLRIPSKPWVLLICRLQGAMALTADSLQVTTADGSTVSLTRVLVTTTVSMLLAKQIWDSMAGTTNGQYPSALRWLKLRAGARCADSAESALLKGMGAILPQGSSTTLLPISLAVEWLQKLGQPGVALQIGSQLSADASTQAAAAAAAQGSTVAVPSPYDSPSIQPTFRLAPRYAARPQPYP